MNQLALLLYVILLAPVAACAPRFAPDRASDERQAEPPRDFFDELVGDYAVGPIYCGASTYEHVFIQDGIFVDVSGKTDPSRFRIDRVDLVLVTWSQGSLAQKASKAYLAFANEPDGSVILHVFYEMGFPEIERSKASMGMKPLPSQSRSFDRRPLMYSQIRFDSEPSDSEIEYALVNDKSKRFILESCE
jgi:hypothetical protein